MKEEVKALFDGICTIAFQFPDGSVVTSHVTTNPEILEDLGLQDLDGLVDLDERKIIPDYMFDYVAGIATDEDITLSSIQELFNQGGKVSW